MSAPKQNAPKSLGLPALIGIIVAIFVLGKVFGYIDGLDGCDTACEDRKMALKIQREVDAMSDDDMDEWLEEHAREAQEDAYRQ